MGLKSYIMKKAIDAATEIATTTAMIGTATHIDKKNQNNSLSAKSKVAASQYATSAESFFEAPKVHILVMTEKRMSIRRSYVIKDNNGNIVYTARSEGLPKSEMALYDKTDQMVGNVEKEYFGNLKYSLKYNGKQIATLHQVKKSLKPRFEIPENGWHLEGGFSQTVVTDSIGGITTQVQYMLTSTNGTVKVEYLNKENEVPALLIALAMILEYHMG